MNNVSEKNQENIQNNIQAKISFRKDMKTLKMNLLGIDKSLKGYRYKNGSKIVNTTHTLSQEFKNR